VGLAKLKMKLIGDKLIITKSISDRQQHSHTGDHVNQIRIQVFIHASAFYLFF